MTVQSIITDARFRLGDTDKTGWSDERLLNLINAGQRDLCRRASVYRRMVYIDLTNGKHIYSLPSDCYNITRIERDGKQLPIYSREDAQNTKIPHSEYAIKSNLNRSQLEIFPDPTDISNYDEYVVGTEVVDSYTLDEPLGVVSGGAIDMDSLVGVLSGVHDFIACNPKTKYGELADISVNTSITRMSPEGVLGALLTNDPEYSTYGFLESIGTEDVVGTYGICTHASFGANYLTVYYDAVPPIIRWTTASLYIEDLWFAAMLHYVVGMARQDDNDEGNYQLGDIELAKYDVEVAKAKKAASKSFNSQVGVVKQTIYRRF